LVHASTERAYGDLGRRWSYVSSLDRTYRRLYTVRHENVCTLQPDGGRLHVSHMGGAEVEHLSPVSKCEKNSVSPKAGSPYCRNAKRLYEGVQEEKQRKAGGKAARVSKRQCYPSTVETDFSQERQIEHIARGVRIHIQRTRHLSCAGYTYIVRTGPRQLSFSGPPGPKPALRSGQYHCCFLQSKHDKECRKRRRTRTNCSMAQRTELNKNPRQVTWACSATKNNSTFWSKAGTHQLNSVVVDVLAGSVGIGAQAQCPVVHETNRSEDTRKRNLLRGSRVESKSLSLLHTRRVAIVRNKVKKEKSIPLSPEGDSLLRGIR